MESVLAMYTIPGIQNYVFSSNRLKEIIGASLLVRSLLEEGFCAVAKALFGDQCKTEWKTEENTLDQSGNLCAEVIYYGGGNLLAVFNDRDHCIQLNRALSQYILERSYSLRLVAAYQTQSSDYKADLCALQKLMAQRNAASLPLETVGSLPFTRFDPIIGEPITRNYKNPAVMDAESAWEGVSSSSFCKLSKYGFARKNMNGDNKTNNTKPILQTFEFDSMATPKGEGSLLALIHIDGNNMGACIDQMMKDVNCYQDAVPLIRKLSANIHQVFTQKAKKDLLHWFSERAPADAEYLPMRILIDAGDDFTFVCNAQYALGAVRVFLKSVSECPCIPGDDSHCFSACAGIAYFHSHYPFTLAYEIAEDCCESAKKAAKQSENLINGEPGNWLDFHICDSGRLLPLSEIRKRYYHNEEGKNLLRRPYQLFQKDANDPLALENLYRLVGELKRLPDNKRAALFKSYPTTSAQAESCRDLTVKMRGFSLPACGGGDSLFDPAGYAVYYDALELLNLDDEILKGEGATCDCK